MTNAERNEKEITQQALWWNTILGAAYAGYRDCQGDMALAERILADLIGYHNGHSWHGSDVLKLAAAIRSCRYGFEYEGD